MLASGTLVIIAWTREGFVLATDSLERGEDRSTHREHRALKQKIFQITERIGCVLGDVGYCEDDKGRAFDLREAIQKSSDMIARSRYTPARVFEDNCRIVSKSVEDYWAHLVKEQAVQVDDLPNPITTLMFVGYFGADPRFFGVEYRSQGGEIKGWEMGRSGFSAPMLMLFGDKQTAEAVLRGTDSRLDAFRKCESVRRANPQDLWSLSEDCSLREAEELITVLIAASLAVRLTPDQAELSGPIQLALIPSTGAFSWKLPPPTHAPDRHSP